MTVTADNQALLRQGVTQLVQPAIWNQLAGDTTTWSDPGAPVISFRAESPLILGNRATVGFYAYYFPLHPWLWVCVSGGAMDLRGQEERRSSLTSDDHLDSGWAMAQTLICTA